MNHPSVPVVCVAALALSAWSGPDPPASVDLPIRVIEAKTSAPIAGACVRLGWGPPHWQIPRSREVEGTTNPEGWVTLPIPRCGEYTVIVRATGYEPVKFPTAHASQGPPDLLVAIEKGGSIGGRVVDRDGKPVRGASVRMWGPERADALMTYWFEALDDLETKSDDDGRFLLQGIPPLEDTDIFVTAPRFGPRLIHVDDLGIGEAMSLPDTILVPGGTVEGTLVDEQDRPIPYVEIYLGSHFETGLDGRVRDLSDPTTTWLPSVSTDASGRFRFHSVGVGTYEICSGTWSDWSDDPISITPERPYARVKVKARAEDRGRAAGTPPAVPEPRATVVVSLKGEDSFPAFLVDGSIGPMVVRDPRGIFVCQASPGNATIRVQLPGSGWVTAECTLRAGQETRVEFPPQTGVTIRGRVVAADGGRGLAGVRVVLRAWGDINRKAFPHFREWRIPSVGAGINRDDARALTDSDGFFSIQRVPAGCWRLWVKAQGWGEYWTLPFKTVAGESPAPILIALEPECRILGRIVDSRPEVGAKLDCSELSLGYDELQFPGWTRGIRRGSGGAFEVKGLPAGTYRVSLSEYVDAFALESPIERYYREDEVTLVPGEERTISIDLDRPQSSASCGILRGRVPVVGAKVCRVPLEWGFDGVGGARTDEEGRVRLWRASSGHNRCAVILDGVKSVRTWCVSDVLFRGTGRALTGDMRLGAGAIAGEVRFEALELRREARAEDGPRMLLDRYVDLPWILRAVPADESPMPEPEFQPGWYAGGHTTRGDVPFFLDGLPPGRYRLALRVGPPFLPAQSEIVEIQEGETKTGIVLHARIDPRPAGSTAVKVMGLDGRPAPDQPVSLLHPLVHEAKTGADGVAILAGLPPGRYAGIIVSDSEAEGAGIAGFDVDVPSSVPAIVRLAQPGRILVHLADREGQPVEGAMISLRFATGIDLLEASPWTTRTRRTDGLGRLWIHQVAEGSYSIEGLYGEERGGPIPLTIGPGETARVRLELRS